MKLKTFLLIAFSLQLIACDNKEITSLSSEIAIYSDNGSWQESVVAAKNMFEWMGYTVELVNSEYIKNHGLDSFNLLCIPGGDMYQYASDLSSAGIAEIKDFISKGGAYVGICGGAYFAGEKVFWRGNQLPMQSLALFQGYSKGPVLEIATYPDSIMAEVIINKNQLINELQPDTAWILYYWGPTFVVEDTTIVAGNYAITSSPCILALQYGEGKVFLIGTHPEIEEDSERDGITWSGDNIFDDNGSDWDLMKNATEWCLELDNN